MEEDGGSGHQPRSRACSQPFTMSKSSSYPRLTESVHHPPLKGITQTRLKLFTNGHFVTQNLSSVLERQRADGDEFVRLAVWSAPGETKPSFSQAMEQLRQSSSIKPYRKGDRLGPSWTNHWVRAVLTIPDSFRQSSEPVICKSPCNPRAVQCMYPMLMDGQRVTVEFDPGCEALLFTPCGEAIHGEHCGGGWVLPAFLNYSN